MIRATFDPNGELIAVKEFFRPLDPPVIGQPVKGSRMVLRRLYRQKKIGLKGCPWTEHRLAMAGYVAPAKEESEAKEKSLVSKTIGAFNKRSKNKKPSKEG